MSETKQKFIIYIDDQMAECEPGEPIIAVADRLGIYIPRFCYHDRLSVVASCRMCLVEVVNAPKTLPACATPVADQMRVYTRSKAARASQRAIMEFLLINHPLDCPICDQGGECELQDIAMGFGEGVSKFTKDKRVVVDEDLGSLVATDMTRCIHCTRCVRFGQEIAGIEELGALERSNRMNIGTYLEKGLHSELSGNVIDLCPVGALTSKPYRFHGRSWGFKQHPSVSPHDCVGSNLYIHSINTGIADEVMRVVPRHNESINEVWLSDRDRFSYEGITHKHRLKQPMIKQNDQWKTVSWAHALSYVADAMQLTLNNHGADQIAALAHPSSTCEEFYLLQKLFRTLGSSNIDHRTQDEDPMSAKQTTFGQPDITALSSIEQLSNIVLIGANPRAHQPLLNHRIRKAIKAGGSCIRIDSHLPTLNYDVKTEHLVTYSDWAQFLAELAKAIAAIKKASTPDYLADVDVSDQVAKLAKQICQKGAGALFVGTTILSHPQASTLRQLLQLIASFTEHTLIILQDNANALGAEQAGMLPFARNGKGMNAKQFLSQAKKLYWLHQIDPEHDLVSPVKAQLALQGGFVIACHAYDTPALRACADVILPGCTFAEMAGTLINLTGTQQRFNAAIPPLGESQAGWKIIAAVAKTMHLDGFDYAHSEAVLDAFNADTCAYPTVSESTKLSIKNLPHRVLWLDDIHPYNLDAIVRHAPSLQAVSDQFDGIIKMNQAMANEYRVHDQQTVEIKQGALTLPAMVSIDEQIADNTLVIAHDIACQIPKHAALELRSKHD